MRSAYPADRVHLEPARKAGWQGRDDNSVISSPSSEFVIDGDHRIRVPDPGVGNFDAVQLKFVGGRASSASSDLFRIALVPDEKVANRCCRNDQRELRVHVMRGQISSRFEQLLSLRRLVSNQQVFRHSFIPCRICDRRGEPAHSDTDFGYQKHAHRVEAVQAATDRHSHGRRSILPSASRPSSVLLPLEAAAEFVC